MENKKEINEKELNNVDGGVVSNPVHIKNNDEDNASTTKKIIINNDVNDAEGKKKRIW